MIAYRAFDAERAFEEARQARDGVETLVRMAYAAARRGRVSEVDACLATIARLDPGRSEEIGDQLRELARCVRNHPSAPQS